MIGGLEKGTYLVGFHMIFKGSDNARKGHAALGNWIGSCKGDANFFGLFLEDCSMQPWVSRMTCRWSNQVPNVMVIPVLGQQAGAKVYIVMELHFPNYSIDFWVFISVLA